MFLLNPWTFGSIVKIAQLVLTGVVVAKEFVDIIRDVDEHND